MEKNDLAMIKAENDRLVADIEKLQQRLREEITRTQAGVRLDLNLEKGRMRQESSEQELKIKEVDTRIEQEIAGLRTAIQASRRSLPVLLCSGRLPTGYDVAIYCRIRYDFVWFLYWRVADLPCSDGLFCAAYGVLAFPRITLQTVVIYIDSGYIIITCYWNACPCQTFFYTTLII